MRRVAVAALLVVGCAGTAAPEPSTSTPTVAVPTSTTTSTSSTTTTTPMTTTTSTTLPPEPRFTGAIEEVDEERLAHSWSPDCPVEADEVVLVALTHWGFDDEAHQGAIVVARDQGEGVLEIFRALFEIGFPIESVIPIGDLAEGIEDDDPTYNNTSGLHCRRATGSSRWSEHARGLAIDINPLLNPFITPNTLWPAESQEYLDRSRDEPGMIHADDDVVQAFLDHGWHWGGYWSSIKDYHHFSVRDR